MFGIIATIIAAKKRHYTFAWVVGIWTALAIILILSGNSTMAVAPGWLFFAISLGMKKKAEINGNEVLPSDSPETNNTTSLPESSSANSTISIPATVDGMPIQSEAIESVDRTVPVPVAIRFCRFCGQELEPGAKFCRHCGARLE